MFLSLIKKQHLPARFGCSKTRIFRTCVEENIFSKFARCNFAWLIFIKNLIKSKTFAERLTLPIIKWATPIHFDAYTFSTVGIILMIGSGSYIQRKENSILKYFHRSPRLLDCIRRKSFRVLHPNPPYPVIALVKRREWRYKTWKRMREEEERSESTIQGTSRANNSRRFPMSGFNWRDIGLEGFPTKSCGNASFLGWSSTQELEKRGWYQPTTWSHRRWVPT